MELINESINNLAILYNQPLYMPFVIIISVFAAIVVWYVVTDWAGRSEL